MNQTIARAMERLETTANLKMRIQRAKHQLTQLKPGTQAYKDKKAAIERMTKRMRAGASVQVTAGRKVVKEWKGLPWPNGVMVHDKDTVNLIGWEGMSSHEGLDMTITTLKKIPGVTNFGVGQEKNYSVPVGFKYKGHVWELEVDPEDGVASIIAPL